MNDCKTYQQWLADIQADVPRCSYQAVHPRSGKLLFDPALPADCPVKTMVINAFIARYANHNRSTGAVSGYCGSFDPAS